MIDRQSERCKDETSLAIEALIKLATMLRLIGFDVQILDYSATTDLYTAAEKIDRVAGRLLLDQARQS